MLPSSHPLFVMGRGRMNYYTSIQAACLLLLILLKEFKSSSIFFPSVIGVLMFLRAKILKRVFKEDELKALNDEYDFAEI